MLKENVKATGTLDVVLTGPDGTVKESFQVPNLVVDAGKEWIADRFADTGIPTQMTHMAVGTDATAAAAGDTALIAEVGRVALQTAGGTPGTPTASDVQFSATFPAGTGTGALVEAGILNAAAAGTMLCRTVFSVINKGANDSLTITWTVSIN